MVGPLVEFIKWEDGKFPEEELRKHIEEGMVCLYFFQDESPNNDGSGQKWFLVSDTFLSENEAFTLYEENVMPEDVDDD